MKNNEKIKKVYQKLVDGVQNFRNTDEYIKFLKFAKKFHNYSFANKVLIFNQFEEATRVAGYKTWEGLGRTVKPGSKGIQIMAPLLYKRKITVKNEDTDEETEEEHDFLTFRPTYVFDVSQTEGEELPLLKKTLDTNNKKDLFDKLKSFCTIPIKYIELSNGSQGYYHSKEKYIALKKNLSIDDKASVLLHELTHFLYDDFNYAEERELSEIFVESVAYIVADYFDLDTSICSFRYINIWADNDVKKVISLGTKIQKTADEFIKKLEDFELQKAV